MMALHERYNAGRPGTLVRPERYWRSVLLRWLVAIEYPGQRNAVYVARLDGHLVGYCFAFTEDGALYLSELAYDETDAVAPLVSAAIAGVGEPAPDRLVATLPWDHAALQLMEATGRSTPIAPIGMMWRINDLSGLLRQVEPVLEQRLAVSSSRGPAGGTVDLVLAHPGGQAALRVREDRLEVDPPGAAPGPSASSCCRLTQTDLVTLLLGSYPSLQWLGQLGLPEQARTELERLFPLAGGVFWLTDNF